MSGQRFLTSEEFLAWLHELAERPDCIHCKQRARSRGVYCLPCWEQQKARAALAALAARAPKRLPGGTARKVQRAIDRHGEDWCGILPPRGTS